MSKMYNCPNCGEIITDDMEKCYCGLDLETIINEFGSDCEV